MLVAKTVAPSVLYRELSEAKLLLNSLVTTPELMGYYYILLLHSPLEEQIHRHNAFIETIWYGISVLS